jgi:hypothetical protein
LSMAPSIIFHPIHLSSIGLGHRLCLSQSLLPPDLPLCLSDECGRGGVVICKGSGDSSTTSRNNVGRGGAGEDTTFRLCPIALVLLSELVVGGSGLDQLDPDVLEFYC